MVPIDAAATTLRLHFAFNCLESCPYLCFANSDPVFQYEDEPLPPSRPPIRSSHADLPKPRSPPMQKIPKVQIVDLTQSHPQTAAEMETEAAARERITAFLEAFDSSAFGSVVLSALGLGTGLGSSEETISAVTNIIATDLEIMLRRFVMEDTGK